MTFMLGLVCWLTYGIALSNPPLIGANAVSIVFHLGHHRDEVAHG